MCLVVEHYGIKFVSPIHLFLFVLNLYKWNEIYFGKLLSDVEQGRGSIVIQEEMVETIENMATQNYEGFIKALLTFELAIEDPLKLDCLYQEYMKNDGLGLLDSYFTDNC